MCGGDGNEWRVVSDMEDDVVAYLKVVSYNLPGRMTEIH
jgi:hypothetical protein